MKEGIKDYLVGLSQFLVALGMIIGGVYAMNLVLFHDVYEGSELYQRIELALGKQDVKESYIPLKTYRVFKQSNIQPAHVPESRALLKKLRKEGITCASGNGASMQPTMFNGNTNCYIEYQSPRVLSPGTIISYEAEDGDYVTHRIVAWYDEGEMIIVEGDNNQGQEIIKKEQIRRIILGTLYT